MVVPKSTKLVSKSPAQYRDDMLRAIRNGLVAKGVSNPDVGRESFYYDLANALGIQLAVNANNANIKADQQMPDTATGEDLARVAKLYGLSLRGPLGSVGLVTGSSSVLPVAIATGAQLVDDNGKRYRVSTGGTFTGVSILAIPVEAIDTGSATNLADGATLRWVSAPAFLGPTATANGAFEGGAEAETDETLRTRLLAYLKNPPGSGNAAQIASWAEEASTMVQKAFVYPAFLGPGSVKVVAVAAPTDTDKSRIVSSTEITTKVEPYVTGMLPEYVYSQTASVNDLATDVSLYLALDSDGGWTDASPFPTPPILSADRCLVGSVTTTSTFTVYSAVAPVNNITRIAWFSQTDWTLYRGIVRTHSALGGDLYTVNLNEPFVGLAAGDYIMPDATYLQDYCDTLLEYFAGLGPGQCTDNVGLLPRAARRPLVGKQCPSDLGPTVGKVFAALNVNGRAEVLDTEWGYRLYSSPTIPAALTSPPNILVPRRIAFYPMSE